MNKVQRNTQNSFLDQPFEQILGDVLSGIVQQMDWKFSRNDEPLPLSMLVGNRAMLPAILWNAEKNHLQFFGRSLGIQFRSDGEATMGAHAVLAETSGQPKSTYIAFCMQALCDAIERFPSHDPDAEVTVDDLRDARLSGSRIPPRGSSATLDHLVEEFMNAHELGFLPWTPDSQPQAPNLSWAKSVTN